MCPKCGRQHKYALLNNTMCNECWDKAVGVPLPSRVSWHSNKIKTDIEKGATMLANYPGSLEKVNTIVATGALTTITPSGKPNVGVATKTGDKFMNGIKFIFDGRDNKQGNLNCVAYGNELVEKIEQFLEAHTTPNNVRPFGRLMVECKVQANNYEKNGQKVYQNELVIQDIWNAPVKAEDTFVYTNTSSVGAEEE